jgi:hypothetical protein
MRANYIMGSEDWRRIYADKRGLKTKIQIENSNKNSAQDLNWHPAGFGNHFSDPQVSAFIRAA